jgi:thiol-disulfide isomerase/thioredoxin
MKSLENLEQFKQENTGKLLVYASAEWCQPCKFMKPIVKQLESNYPQVKFTTFDVDAVKPLALFLQITSMPTFTLFIDKKEVGQVVGADRVQLEKLLRDHSDSVESSIPGQLDLQSFIELSGVDLLNCKASMADLLAGKPLESDADEQIIMHIPFTCPVKLHSISLKGAKTVKTFINKASALSFDQAEDTVPVESFEIDGIQALKYVRYQSVKSLTVSLLTSSLLSTITKVRTRQPLQNSSSTEPPLSSKKSNSCIGCF